LRGGPEGEHNADDAKQEGDDYSDGREGRTTEGFSFHGWVWYWVRREQFLSEHSSRSLCFFRVEREYLFFYDLGVKTYFARLRKYNISPGALVPGAWKYTARDAVVEKKPEAVNMTPANAGV
jgi:hypothetical protein